MSREPDTWYAGFQRTLRQAPETASGPDLRPSTGMPATVWENVSHEQMTTEISTDANPAAVAESAQEWLRIGEELLLHERALARAVEDSRGDWQGPGGDAVRRHLTAVAHWLGTTGRGALLAGRQQQLQAQALEEARRRMAANPPVEFSAEAANARLQGITDPVEYARQLGEDTRVRQAREAAHAEAVRIMTEYDRTLAQTVATPFFAAPPELPGASAVSSGQTAPGRPGAGTGAGGVPPARSPEQVVAAGAAQPGSPVAGGVAAFPAADSEGAGGVPAFPVAGGVRPGSPVAGGVSPGSTGEVESRTPAFPAVGGVPPGSPVAGGVSPGSTGEAEGRTPAFPAVGGVRPGSPVAGGVPVPQPGSEAAGDVPPLPQPGSPAAGGVRPDLPAAGGVPPVPRPDSPVAGGARSDSPVAGGVPPFPQPDSTVPAGTRPVVGGVPPLPPPDSTVASGARWVPPFPSPDPVGAGGVPPLLPPDPGVASGTTGPVPPGGPAFQPGIRGGRRREDTVRPGGPRVPELPDAAPGEAAGVPGSGALRREDGRLPGEASGVSVPGGSRREDARSPGPAGPDGPRPPAGQQGAPGTAGALGGVPRAGGKPAEDAEHRVADYLEADPELFAAEQPVVPPTLGDWKKNKNWRKKP
ncbi:PPE domain-containing protein [Amycolatopsis sp. NPDC021455]|uniref:PPE domain-containing protein n=1 Tax=Amycolatopsis sp. NPDC021455 TaxID=3154901 RepID=UPI00340336B9